jgi:hypothetical protein
MSACPQDTLQSEWSVCGEQTLIPGVRPVSLRARLIFQMQAPLLPRATQKPMTIGLFDEDARNQLELF